MYIFLAEASKIAYLYEDCHFYYFVNLNFFNARNSFIATPLEGVNGQQYEKTEISQ